MIFATPVKGTHMWENPVNGKQFPVQGVDFRKTMVGITPDGVEVMDAPQSLGRDSIKNQLDSEQYRKMTEGIEPEQAAQQYAAYVLEEMMPK